MPLHPHPDLIISSARIFNGHSQQPGISAVAIHGAQIVAVGSDQDILPLAGAQTQVIHADGRWLLPAVCDAHTHLSLYAERKLQVDLSGCQSLEEACRMLRQRIKCEPEGSWILGGGWDKNLWGMENFPTAAILDELSRQHFIALQSKDWHSFWVNTPVLQFCGISSASADPPGGKILRHPDSAEPSGIVQENACALVTGNIPPVEHDRLNPLLKEAFAEFHRQGITSIHSVEAPRSWENYLELECEKQLGLRIRWYFPERFLAESEERGYRPGKETPLTKICGVKIFSDGALGSQTAFMLHPYENSTNMGVATMTAEELQQKIRACVEKKFACAVHAIGDAANRRVLDAFQAVDKASKSLRLRHRIEHAQLLADDDIGRFRQLGITASMQPIHLAADIPMIERYWGERGRNAYAFASLLKSGARLIFGSDTPIESFNPWRGMYSALERRYLCDSANPRFCPRECISLEAALQAYTSEPARVSGDGHHLGRVAPGYLADLILIDSDPFRESAEVLPETRVQLTIMGGKVVYQG